MSDIFATMFRVPTVIALITLLLSSSLLQSVVLLDFKLNQDLISTTLCVQKDEVQNTCSGKCHLTKQLEKTESDAEDAPRTTESFHELLLYLSYGTLPCWLHLEEDSEKNPAKNQLNGIATVYSIFHPPRSI